MFYIYDASILSKTVCSELIKGAEMEGFKEAAVNAYGVQELNKAVRNNSKYEFFNKSIAADFESYAPKLYKGRKFSAIGNFFRIYKYEQGQFFKTHKDGHVITEDGESLLTMLIYLNDNDATTVLMPYGQQQEWAHTHIPCVAGSMLIFDHDTWHAGKTVENGVKYVLRTDIFYKE